MVQQGLHVACVHAVVKYKQKPWAKGYTEKLERVAIGYEFSAKFTNFLMMHCHEKTMEKVRVRLKKL